MLMRMLNPSPLLNGQAAPTVVKMSFPPSSFRPVFARTLNAGRVVLLPWATSPSFCLVTGLVNRIASHRHRLIEEPVLLAGAIEPSVLERVGGGE